jgi:cytosine/adenosine deaminase-related metal-dependent hydrolase
MVAVLVMTDGSRIAFRAAPGPEPGNAADIVVLDLKSSALRNLTNDPGAEDRRSYG